MSKVYVVQVAMVIIQRTYIQQHTQMTAVDTPYLVITVRPLQIT